jgi:uncharacterized protein (DUF169 family)
MATVLYEEYHRLMQGFGVDGLDIPACAVKFYRWSEPLPDEVAANQPASLSFTSCQAVRQASLGDALCLTRENIGCVAAAISLGLVDADDPAPLSGPRVYTELMREQTNEQATFEPPSPADFSAGLVYACKAAGRPEFGLFGSDDCGRYQDVATAKAAIREMLAIQPAIHRAVFFYSPLFAELEIRPDVVVMSVRPVELTRLVQAYQYHGGKRIQASMGGLRAVNSDLIARPYLSGEINVSPYCLGARLIGQFEPDRLGIGLPYAEFQVMLHGLESSRTGFPFHLYPGATR